MRKDSLKPAKTNERLMNISTRNSNSSIYHISQVPKMVLVDDEEYFFEVEDF
jgi:hypothetical protein